MRLDQPVIFPDFFYFIEEFFATVKGEVYCWEPLFSKSWLCCLQYVGQEIVGI